MASTGFRSQPTGQLYTAMASASRDVKSGTLISTVHPLSMGVGGTGHIPPVDKIVDT